MLNLECSIYQLASHVWNKGFWHTDAFGRLVVFENCCNNAREGKGRTVEGVAEFNLLVLSTAVAAMETVGLVTIEIADRTYLKPAVLGLGIHLKIITESSRETHIATA